MNEFSFYDFTLNIPKECCCEIAIPISVGSDISCFFPEQSGKLDICTINGSVIKENIDCTWSDNFKHFKVDEDLSDLLAVGDCFRLRVDVLSGAYYSTPLCYVGCEDKHTSLIEYKCNENQFGFPYSTHEGYNSVRLPLRIFNKQYPQKQDVYVTASGRRIMLFSTVNSEWEFETDYIPEVWHKKLIVALSHDEIMIDGVKYTQEGEYRINWDDVIVTECGVELVKGTTKLRGDSLVRNSNC